MSNQYCDFSIGETIAGKYNVIRCLGEGSYGKVYQVSDNTGNKYALKIQQMHKMSPDIRENMMKRFDMEYHTGQIESPYLVHSYDHGMVNGNPYILMEFCPNGDLLHLPPSTDWNKVAHEVLYGLGALHQNGKVHRDLKPANVLIKENGIAALSDFGISGDRNHRLTLRGQIWGSYAFIPPEQMFPEKSEYTVLPTSDIFSFGVMMFLLLTGKLPFGTINSNSDLSSYHIRSKMGDWDKSALSGSPFYKAIEGCLVPNFRQRLQSVDEVIELLPKYYDGYSRNTQRNNDDTILVKGYLLRVMQGEEYGKTYDLTRMLHNMNFLTIGRADKFTNNDIAIKEEQSTYISRQHCTIEKESDGSFKIRDGQRDSHSYNGWHGSTNGTYVNSVEVSPNGYYLRHGDIISIGDVKMRFEYYGEKVTMLM